jgi:hypothetical protein
MMIAKFTLIAILMVLGLVKGSRVLRKLQVADGGGWSERNPNSDEIKVAAAFAVSNYGSEMTYEITQGLS